MSERPLNEMVREATENLQVYARNQADYLRLDMVDKTVRLSSLLISRLILILVIGLCIMVASIGLSIYLGTVIESYHLGFFIVGAFYLLVGLLVYAMRRKLIAEPILKAVIRELFEEEDLEEEPNEEEQP